MCMHAGGISALVRFARLASDATTGSAVLPLLDAQLVAHAGVTAVAVLELDDDGGARLVSTAHQPRELVDAELDADAIGDELTSRLRGACGRAYALVRSKPLVYGRDLFGAVTLFYSSAPTHEEEALAEGLIDLAAVSLGAASQLHKLVRSHAELSAAQEALLRSEKLRALGEMAAGVSHDLKNILNPLTLHLQLAERANARGHKDDVAAAAAEMKQILARGLQTIERLRDYGRQEPESRSAPVDLRKLAHEAREIARPRMASRGGVVNTFVEDLGDVAPVLGRSGDIVSALVNLIVNAIDAMPEGGRITLRTGRDETTSFVEVADDGPGIPPEVERRVFEPFFTTKGEGGTGLGLAMVYACMQRHGGKV
ncbi:MAG TPA: HAMP domain-containing sensor histidine kinase, partial [Minicystis sp.]|nr:HAMP domain-containing sensor histidine kinase [Minicystis sp.]